MAFCDYCNCADCKFGQQWLSHAQTESGKWICDVCYYYECCLNAGMPSPCEDKSCEHRPVLKTDWINYEDKIY